MKGVITVNIEVDYSTMLDPKNQGALYLFTGAKTVDEMIGAHMNYLSTELSTMLKTKPLLTYSLDGVVVPDNDQSGKVTESEEGFSDEMPDEMPRGPEKGFDVDEEEEEPVLDQDPEYGLVESLDEAIETVSLELGIPNKIKANEDLIDQLKDKIGEDEVTSYKGFPIEREGMEEPFIIVYKTYSGSDIKFYSNP